MEAKKDYYCILEINPTATKKEIEKAYRKLGKIYHPELEHNYNDFEARKKYYEASRAYYNLTETNARINRLENTFLMPLILTLSGGAGAILFFRFLEDLKDSSFNYSNGAQLLKLLGSLFLLGLGSHWLNKSR